MSGSMLSPEEIEDLRQDAIAASILIEAEFRRMTARSIAREIAELEDAIGRMPTLEIESESGELRNRGHWMAWTALNEEIAVLKMLSDLTTKRLDDDCVYGSCGPGSSIFG